MRNKFLCLSHPAHGVLLWQPELRKEVVKAQRGATSHHLCCQERKPTDGERAVNGWQWVWTQDWSVHELLFCLNSYQFSSVQSLSRVQLFATQWITARQACLSITNSRSSLRLTSIKSVMPSSHLILCCPLLFLPPIPPSIRVFSNESTLHMRWPKYRSFSFSTMLPKLSQLP